MNNKMITCLLLTALCLSSCNNNDEEKSKAPMRVATKVANSTSCGSGKTFVGIVEESEATSVSFTSMGVVKRVLVSEGQTVTQGQLIAEVDDTQSRNMLSAAEAQMNQANDALERYTMLHDAGSLPEAQWVEIQSKVAQAKSQLDLARKNLTDCQLTAPVAGVIGRKFVRSGETVLPSQAVVTILNINNVKVKVSVPEKEINNISTNSASRINVAAAGVSVGGGTIEKGVQADALTHTYDIRINLHNAEHKLLPGMVASVDLNLSGNNSSESNIMLPITSVQKRSDGSYFVWIVDNDNKAHRCNISIGEVVGNNIVVESGLNEGNRVVVEGYQKLSEGTEVSY